VSTRETVGTETPASLATSIIDAGLVGELIDGSSCAKFPDRAGPATQPLRAETGEQ
jgi:hypothetical protein